MLRNSSIGQTHNSLKLGIYDLPSAATIRQRLDQLMTHNVMLFTEHEVASIQLFRTDWMSPTAFPNGMIPLDFWRSPHGQFQDHEGGANHTYKEIDIYVPIMVYIGLVGFMIEEEHREGRHHVRRIHSIVGAYSPALCT